jgi:hypothetical protein
VIEPLHRNRPRSSVYDALPDLPFRAWQGVCERRARLVTEEQQAERVFNELSARRDEAVRADRAALGAAIAAGEPEPGDEAVAAVDDEMEAVRRRHEAIGVAIRAVEDELGALLAEHGPEWAEKRAADADTAREEARTTLEAHVDATRRLTVLEAEVRFLRSFPDAKAWKTREPRLPGLVGRNGDPYTRAEVHDALAAALDPPQPASSLPSPMPVPDQPKAVA